MMIFTDGYSRFNKVHCLPSKDDTAECLMKYLVNIVPPNVEMVRSDERRGVLEGKFGALCTRETIRQELTIDDTPTKTALLNAKSLLYRQHALR